MGKEEPTPNANIPLFDGSGDILVFFRNLERCFAALEVKEKVAHLYYRHVLLDEVLQWFLVKGKDIAPREGETRFQAVKSALEAKYAGQEMDISVKLSECEGSEIKASSIESRYTDEPSTVKKTGETRNVECDVHEHVTSMRKKNCSIETEGSKKEPPSPPVKMNDESYTRPNMKHDVLELSFSRGRASPPLTRPAAVFLHQDRGRSKESPPTRKYNSRPPRKRIKQKQKQSRQPSNEK